jgi:hypothetical protein
MVHEPKEVGLLRSEIKALRGKVRRRGYAEAADVRSRSTTTRMTGSAPPSITC